MLSVLVMLQSVCFAQDFRIDGINQNAVVELSPISDGKARLIYISHDNIPKFIKTLEKNRDELKKIESILLNKAVISTSAILGIGVMFTGLIGAGILGTDASNEYESSQKKLNKKTVGLIASTIGSGVGGIAAGVGIMLAPILIGKNMEDKNRSQLLSSELGRSLGTIKCKTRWGTHIEGKYRDAQSNIDQNLWPKGLIHLTQTPKKTYSENRSTLTNYFEGVDDLINALKTVTLDAKDTKDAPVLHSDEGEGIIISFIVSSKPLSKDTLSISIEIYKQGNCRAYENDNRNENFVKDGKLILERLYTQTADRQTTVQDILENKPRGICNPPFELFGRKIVTAKPFHDIDSKLIENVFSFK